MIKKKTAIIISALVILILIFGTKQWYSLRQAHSTFENYYAFRGCVQLLDKTDTYATCKLGNGETIKIVKYQDKWYLDGDLPWACLGKLCFGI